MSARRDELQYEARPPRPRVRWREWVWPVLVLLAVLVAAVVLGTWWLYEMVSPPEGFNPG